MYFIGLVACNLMSLCAYLYIGSANGTNEDLHFVSHYQLTYNYAAKRRGGFPSARANGEKQGFAIHHPEYGGI